MAILVTILMLFMRRYFSFLGFTFLGIILLAFCLPIRNLELIDAISYPELFLTFLLLNSKIKNDDINNSFVLLNKLASAWVILVFFELMVSFFLPNRYSWSPVNFAFVSIFMQDLNQLSIVTNLTFGWSMAHCIIGHKRYYHVIVAFCSIIVCLFTYNRTAWIILVLSAIYLTYYFRVLSLNKIIFTGFLTSIGYLLLPLIVELNPGKELNDTASSVLRFVLLFYGFEVYMSNWIIGVGPSNIHAAMREGIDYSQSSPMVRDALIFAKNTTLLSGKWNTRPHNAFLVLLMSYGLLIIPLISHWFNAFISIFKRKHNFSLFESKLNVFLFTLTFHALMYPQYRLFLYAFGIKLVHSIADMHKKNSCVPVSD